MQRFIPFFTFFFSLLLTSCYSSSYQKTDEGITVTVKKNSSNEKHHIRLQVVNDRIIHVSVTPEEDFSTEKSLITVPDLKYSGKFEVSEDARFVILTTCAVDVKVNKESGEVAFFDKKGNAILRENEGGGKSFIPIEVEGTKGYTLRLVFDSPDNEAFYGLGQHQSDEFNYKGKNESMFQYNTKVSIPFIDSSRNYGILWDNYSLSKFGDPHDYAQLDQFKLFDKNGDEGALTATYTNKQTGETIERQESIINYENLELIKNFPEGFSLNGAQVNWEGEMEAQKDGIHRFLLHYAGYTTIKVNNKEVVKERWRTAWNPNDYKFSLNMKAGVRVPLKIEWEPDGDVSYISLKVLDPLPETDQNKLSFWSEMGNEIDYYFIFGDDMDEVISGYRTVTGKSQVMPKWAMGFWQS
ncbi:MAG TPA: alpha-xylosidase, partial [Prolixibacteraceae bacterium]|nr:alpha-xylosidase [Prolixibacteraceae bacterium]